MQRVPSSLLYQLLAHALRAQNLKVLQPHGRHDCNAPDSQWGLAAEPWEVPAQTTASKPTNDIEAGPEGLQMLACQVLPSPRELYLMPCSAIWTIGKLLGLFIKLIVALCASDSLRLPLNS